MREKRALFIGGANLLCGMNHRSHHLLAYLQQHVDQVDSVAFQNFAAGAQPSRIRKVWDGSRLLRRENVQTIEKRQHRQIIIRKFFLPHPLNLLCQDSWIYHQLIGVLRSPYDFAIVGHAENAVLAWRLKKRGLISRLIYDDWDYYPGLERDRIGARLMTCRERLIMRTADVVMTVNPLLAENRRSQGARAVIVVPNGLDLGAFAVARNRTRHPPTMVYIGTLDAHWGVDLAIVAMRTLVQQFPTLRLIIAGQGPDADALRRLSDKLGVADSVTFLGAFPYHELPKILAQADIGIATSCPDSTFRYYASPLKLIEYMAAGLPIIATRVGQQARTLSESGAGLLIDHRPQDFVTAAQILLTNQTFAQQCSAAGITYADSYDWAAIWDHALRTLDAPMSNSNLQCRDLVAQSTR